MLKKMSRACSYGKATTTVAAKIQHFFSFAKKTAKILGLCKITILFLINT